MHMCIINTHAYTPTHKINIPQTNKHALRKHGKHHAEHSFLHGWTLWYSCTILYVQETYLHFEREAQRLSHNCKNIRVRVHIYTYAQMLIHIQGCYMYSVCKGIQLGARLDELA